MMTVNKDNVRVINGRIQDDRRAIDISEIANMNRVRLEEHCIYLMKKRAALEDAIANLYRSIAELNETIAKMEEELIVVKHKLVAQSKIATETISRLNKQNNILGEELVKTQAVLEECHSQ